MSNTQKIAMRLLRNDTEPQDAVVRGVSLEDWDIQENACIAFDSTQKSYPRWTRFLGLSLSEEQKKRIYNQSTYCLAFIWTSGRWFVISFGQGHVKLKREAYELDFGLRVVLNAVNPNQLTSADTRTPDENTIMRRTQTSQGSDQVAFSFDFERDLIHGLAGKPKDLDFGSYVSGKDSLMLHKKMELENLITTCDEVYSVYNKKDYEEIFPDIGKIRLIRNDKNKENKLDNLLVGALANAVEYGEAESIHFAYPEIIDPDKATFILYRGFRSRKPFPDLALSDYLEEFRKSNDPEFRIEHLKRHTVNQVDENNRPSGQKWNLRECIVFETEFEGERYVLSGNDWYQVDKSLEKQVQRFFDETKQVKYLPNAKINEKENEYNIRVAQSSDKLICLDAEKVTSSASISQVEICDILSLEGHLIHVKRRNKSSMLSHLFKQGTYSAQLIASNDRFRDKAREKINNVQSKHEQTGFEKIIPEEATFAAHSNLTVVYAVIVEKKTSRPPFFSLLTFSQAAKQLKSLGYKVAFAWIEASDPA